MTRHYTSVRCRGSFSLVHGEPTNGRVLCGDYVSDSTVHPSIAGILRLLAERCNHTTGIHRSLLRPRSRLHCVGRFRVSYCFEPSVLPSLCAFHLDSVFDGSDAIGKRALRGPHSVLVTDDVSTGGGTARSRMRSHCPRSHQTYQ